MVASIAAPTTRLTPVAIPPSLAALLAALVLGALGDALFHGSALGINLLLWVAAIAAVTTWLAHRFGLANNLPDRWLLIAVGFASATAIRGDPMLRGLDAAAIAAALTLVTLRHIAEARCGRVRDYLVAAGRTTLHLAGSAAMLPLHDVPWVALHRGGATRRLLRIGGGLLLAVPVALVFGALFASAEPVLGDISSALLEWVSGPAAAHVIVALLLSWIAAALLRAGLWPPTRRAEILETDYAKMGTDTVIVGLGAMPAIFAIFLGLQARELVGGDAWVRATTGLTYAEFARRGFFQMVAATVLSLPLLYAGCTMLAPGHERGLRSVRALAGAQLLLNGLVTLSAANRLRLYVAAYGLTEDRILGVAVMLWLTCASAWFALTVLRGRPERFTFGAVASGFAVLAALNAANPGALIASVHMRRVTQGKQLDEAYVRQLSENPDAVPVLVSSLTRLPTGEGCTVAAALVARENDRLPADWRGWNRSEATARRLIGRLRDAGAAGCS